MSELLPTRQAADLQHGLLDYLATTFALADPEAQESLRDFLRDSEQGMFKGPFVRTRLPFAAAVDPAANALEGMPPGFAPYGHQSAAHARLRHPEPGAPGLRPLPTLVTTGTGSGKTECFLYPVLDHVIRARRASPSGAQGIKALILYPMNALANDQALRLAKLITAEVPGGNPLAGVRAALYTGQKGRSRTTVRPDSLITDRTVIREDPPDILLTNYKMLDQLLLRHEDQEMWRLSADSLQYLILDEFHTYDGAQGTDVAMLLRRLGLALKSHWPAKGSDNDTHTPGEWERPLGRMTPVGTSATLGDKNDQSVMLRFAETIFGEPFTPDAVITESRMPLDEWLAVPDESVAGLTPLDVTTSLAEEINRAVRGLGPAPGSPEICRAVISRLWTDGAQGGHAMARNMLHLAKAHPVVMALIAHTSDARHLDELDGLLFPGEDPGPSACEIRREFLVNLVAALSHLRAREGRAFVTVESHLWIREITRVDREATSLPRFLWSDDGIPVTAGDTVDTPGEALPAIFCRHCGRSGWGIELGMTGNELAADQTRVRANHAAREGRFRALIHAPAEELRHRDGDAVDGLRWFDVQGRCLASSIPADDDDRVRAGGYLPVLIQIGQDADTASHDDVCPSCQQPDGIRFLGSAIATLLSVSLSTLFGTPGLDLPEKKALVFTDSVQDAAHRAGFVASRSHTLTLRAVLRGAVGDREVSLSELVDAALEQAGEDSSLRHRIVPPDLAESDEFFDFWHSPGSHSRKPRAAVRRRLLFDAVLEFGLTSRIGRTLEQTGSVSVTVDAGSPDALANDARTVLKAPSPQEALDNPLDALTDQVLVRWARGVLERIRLQGGIEHEWFDRYVKQDGSRYLLWGGRPKHEGMPAFPTGRSAPAFPRVGKQKNTKGLLDPVTDAQSWYSRWTARLLGVSGQHGAALARGLLARFAERGVLREVNTDGGGTAYMLPQDRVLISATKDEDLRAGAHSLVCDVCRTGFVAGKETISQLETGPCLLVRCAGRLERDRMDPANYYRRLYSTKDMRVVVAAEHTSLLDDRTRIMLENSFRASEAEPGSPNVLVATPTLEMGIDIGDLSSVFLASLPRTVASYLQRVGRAGRWTGNSFNLAFVTGRGEHLPRLGDPLSMINGAVRPPATYLSAEETLHRQYLAHLMDSLARRPDEELHPTSAQQAIGSVDDGTYLGTLIELAETDAGAHLDRFLGTFSSLRPEAAEALRHWATPADDPGTSGLAGEIRAAVARWTSRREELHHRRQSIVEVVPDLEAKAASPAATDADQRALRVAKAALKLVDKELAEAAGEHWIGTLEEHGLLPNYTLLDDSVSLAVSMTWFDPDTGQYDSESSTYQRGSANALREFAPGATFYARGFEIEVDTVDLGADAEAIRMWAFCPACGYGTDVEASGTQNVPFECPRCGDDRMADLQQQLPVVELKRASAEIRRDDSRIGDRRDERRRPSFTVLTAADIDPDGIAERWHVTDYDFGVQYLRRITLRQLNVGPRNLHASKRELAGGVVPTELFRVCKGCGHLDTASNANSVHEHRPWCQYRTSLDEHTAGIALSRTLTTQAAVITLPWTVAMGDSFALPSLEAAVLMGLRDQFGGMPTHLGVQSIKAPAPSGGGTVDALLLHDLVPGGTGYLSEFARPENVRDLLFSAWQTLSTCPCREEGRLACHRCLLPVAAPHRVPLTSRDSAQRHLRDILMAGTGEGDPTPSMMWSTQSEAPPPANKESHLELLFREAFVRMLKGLGATIKEIPGVEANTISATLGGTEWKLTPQVIMHGSKPDFVLTSPNRSQVAIFTDGYAWHASPAKNRIADDAHKRAVLRGMGMPVLGITHSQVSDYLAGEPAKTPEWLEQPLATAFMNSYNYNLDSVKTLNSPFQWLAAWIQSSEAAELMASLAKAVPLFFMQLPIQYSVPAGADAGLLVQALATGTEPPEWALGDARNSNWRQLGPLGMLITQHAGANEVHLVLDDRPSAVEAEGFRQHWQDWLAISNALTLRPGEFKTTITTVTSLAPATTAPATGVVDIAWQNLLEYSGPEAQAMAAALAERGTKLPDLVGEEAADGIPVDFGWSQERIVLYRDATPEDEAAFAADGWRVVAWDADAVAVALTSQEK